MRTDDLIEALSKDAGNVAQSVERRFGLFEAGGFAVAAALFLATLGPRADLAQAMLSPWFLLKVAFVALLVVLLLPLAVALARPGARVSFGRIAIAGAALLLAIVADLVLHGRADWQARMVGTNAMLCLTFIPVLALAPLIAALRALRHGAPVRPAMTGFTAGLLSGAIGATLYAFHCSDDSPLFVALWYSLAIAGVAALGAVLGRLMLRW